MNTRFLLLLVSLVAGLLFASPAATAAYPAADAPDANNFLLIENVGQFADGARFQAQAGGATLWLAQDALWLTLVDAAAPTSPEDNPAPTTGAHLRLSFPGANPDARLEPFDPAPTTISYFIGNDPDNWHPAVPVWRGARYVDLYPGIDLELTGAGGQLLPRLVVRDANALAQVQLRVEGAEAMALDAQGGLRLMTVAGDYTFPLFTVVTPDGTPLALTDSPIVDGDMLRTPFTAAPSPQSHPAAPESAIVYSTFFGGSGQDGIATVATDAIGNIYVSSNTHSLDFPVTPGAFDPTLDGETDLIVSKFNPEGSTLLYSTFMGGTVVESAAHMVVDGYGNAYITGHTMSADFPTTAFAYDRTFNGATDGFVAKLNSSGTALFYSTFLGGTSNDWGNSIAIDNNAFAYITGQTRSSNFPVTADAIDPSYNGLDDVLVTILSPSGGALQYSTFLGGNKSDVGIDIALDEASNIYITGWTTGVFPVTAGAFDTTANGESDIFITKIIADGSALAFSTYLGGGIIEFPSALWVDAAGNSYATGHTESTNFPVTPGAYNTSYSGGDDIFVTKLNATGSALLYSTYVGGTMYERGLDITTDTVGNAYIVGLTHSFDFPTIGDTRCLIGATSQCPFVFQLNTDGSLLARSEIVQSSNIAEFESNLVLPSGQLLAVGSTSSANFPTTPGAYDRTHNGSLDGVIVMFDLNAAPTAVQVDTLRVDSAAVPLAAFALALLAGVALLVGRRR